MDAGWLGRLKPGDRIGFKDARGSTRTWRVRDVGTDGCWVEARKTAYIMNGVELSLASAGKDPEARTVIDNLPAQDGVIELRNGDTLMLNSSKKPGRPTLRDKDGSLLNPGIVSLPIPEIYRDCCPGESVFFDDGRVSPA